MKESTKLFLDGKINESEFYCTKKECLISLREYYEALKKLDMRFRFFSQEELEKVKGKLDWVDSISYDGLQNENNGEFFETAIHIYSKDKIELIVSRNKETGLYEDLARDIPKLYLINPRVRARIQKQKDLRKIQPELREIESIGRNVYKNHINPKTSVSGYFDINYAPGLGMLVSTDYELVASFFERKPSYKETPYLSEKTKNKILDLIQMNRRDLPNVEEPVVVGASVFPDKETEERVYKTLQLLLKNNQE